MMNPKNNYLVVIAGPTAVGKTDTVIKLARHFDSVIISADSRQLYRELKIGTSAPTEIQLKAVPHFFIANKSIHDDFNASMYEAEVNHLLSDLFKSYRLIFLAGGSGMYIEAVCKGIDDLPEVDKKIRGKIQDQFDNEGIESLRRDLKILDPVSYSRLDLRNPKRIQKAIEITVMTGKPYSSFLTSPEKKRDYGIIRLALDIERKELYRRINERVLDMMDAGFEEEAREVYPYRNYNALNTVGYKELFLYFDGRMTREEAIRSIQASTRRYARKQITWFRRESSYKWFNPDDLERIILFISGCTQAKPSAEYG
jgi:tRNA dimethylallyltransferase